MRETWVGSLDWEDPLEKEMATHSSILVWRIPWREEPGGLQSTRSQRAGHDSMTFTFQSYVIALETTHCCLGTKSCPTLRPHELQHTRLPCPSHNLLDFVQAHVHCISDVIRPSHSLQPPSPLTLCLSQHQGLFQWVSSSYQVAKVLELQLQHQSFQSIFRIDFL